MYFINIGTPWQARNKLPTIGSFFSIEVHHLCTIISTSSHCWENALWARIDVGTLLQHSKEHSHTEYEETRKTSFLPLWLSNSSTAKTSIDNMVPFYRDVHIYHPAICMPYCSVIYCCNIVTFDIALLQCERFCTNESVCSSVIYCFIVWWYIATGDIASVWEPT